MYPELEKYAYIVVVAIAVVLFWFFSQPASELASWETEGKPIHLPSIPSIAPLQPKEQSRNPFGDFSYSEPEVATVGKEGKAKKSISQIPELHIYGIIFNGRFNLVNINGKFYTEGESLDGVEIVQILPDKALFSFKGRIVEKLVSVPDIRTMEGS